MPIAITQNTRMENIPQRRAVQHAADHLMRDIQTLCLPGDAAGISIQLHQNTAYAPETYTVNTQDDALFVRAADDLGFIFGLYAISRNVLGIEPFWFWNDQEFIPKEAYPVADDFALHSKPFAVRWRGWFINDEVLLHTWTAGGSRELPWEMAFEALLRLGGNMVIPGTGENAHIYRSLADAMGLYVTHHHAEPLGAPMFAVKHPELTPSYAEHSAEFDTIWQESIDKQKDRSVLWNLGFRGQGDRPFWVDDPRYATPEARGKLIGDIIAKQYRMVRSARPDAACCTNLYGEVLELYRQGHLQLPGGVIKIWADNGYGKMVSRRQEGHNPRVPSLPGPADEGPHGLYYHVSFYDLQAANHITALSNPPSMIQTELTDALHKGADAYWIINSSNIKPHVYYLSMIAQLWQTGTVDIPAWQADYTKRYYGAAAAYAAARCFDSYFSHAVRYGEHADDCAGDQYFTYAPRILVSQFMRGGSPAAALRWAAEEATLHGQAEHILAICREAADSYTEHTALCEQTAKTLQGAAKALFDASLMVQANILLHSSRGAVLACQSVIAALDGNDKEAFYLAGKSRQSYKLADSLMRGCERGKWVGFYQNDCLTDISRSAWLMESMMRCLRNRGDGPHFFAWQREYLYTPGEARVLLITNMEKILNDDELFTLMEQRKEASI